MKPSHGRPRRLDLEREVAEFWDKNPDLTAQEVGERFDVSDETVVNYYRRYWGESFSVRKRRLAPVFISRTFLGFGQSSSARRRAVGVAATSTEETPRSGARTDSNTEFLNKQQPQIRRVSLGAFAFDPTGERRDGARQTNAELVRDSKTPERGRSSQIRRGNDPAFVQSVAEYLHDHPEMTTDEVGEKFGISGRSAREYFIRFYKVSLAPFRKRFQEKRDAEICDYIQKNPDATLYAIAKRFGVSEGTVSRVSNALRSKNRRKQRKLDDVAAKEYIKENYVRPTEALARELGRTVPKVNALISELQTEGFFVNIKRAETFAAYLKDNPDEGYGGAARFFAVSAPFVRYALNAESEPIWSRKADEDFHRRCVAAPYDVAESIKRNKGFGVSLPPEEMKRFAALHRMKRDRGTRVR